MQDLTERQFIKICNHPITVVNSRGDKSCVLCNTLLAGSKENCSHTNTINVLNESQKCITCGQVLNAHNSQDNTQAP